jgi:hypothetical protein
MHWMPQKVMHNPDTPHTARNALFSFLILLPFGRLFGFIVSKKNPHCLFLCHPEELSQE